MACRALEFEAITGFVSYQLTPSIYVSGFVGPEYTASKDIVPQFCFPGFGCFGYHEVHQAEWNVAEGGTFGWLRTKNAFRAGYRHQNSNGGGLLGTVSLYQMTATYRRALSPRWNLLYRRFVQQQPVHIAIPRQRVS